MTNFFNKEPVSVKQRSTDFQQKKEIEEEKETVSREEQTRKEILELIESNYNRNYFREDKFDIFFEKVFSLSNQMLLYDNAIFQDWITYDLKYIIQVIIKQKSILNMSKFVVFMKVEDDPEIIELLCDTVCKHSK